VPSSQPSLLPSTQPSVLPSEIPTFIPSASPSALPSLSPSSSPTLRTQIFSFQQETSFDDCDELDPLAKTIIEDVTGEIIHDWLRNKYNNTIVDLEVSLRFVHQTKAIFGDFNSTKIPVKPQLPDGGNQTVNEGENRRILLIDGHNSLEAEKTSMELTSRKYRILNEVKGLHIIFDIFVKLKSPESFEGTVLQADIVQIFDTAREREDYILALQQKANVIPGVNPFERINRAEIRVNGNRVMALNEAADGTSTNWTIWGASIGAGAFATILVGVVFLRRRNSTPTQSNDLSFMDNKDFNESQTTNNGPTTIDVDAQQDISTLGEPTVGPLFNTFEKDGIGESTMSPGNFDFQRLYNRNTHGEDSVSTSVRKEHVKQTAGVKDALEDDSGSFVSSSSGRTSAFRENISMFTDDDSLERMYGEREDEKLEIIVPAGRLGVVIDTPLSGVPMVHAIKETSILSDKVRIGDKLISVDGEDTTQMSAIKVSKLISSKAQNPQRILVFLRPPDHV